MLFVNRLLQQNRPTTIIWPVVLPYIALLRVIEHCTCVFTERKIEVAFPLAISGYKTSYARSSSSKACSSLMATVDSDTTQSGAWCAKDRPSMEAENVPVKGKRAYLARHIQAGRTA